MESGLKIYPQSVIYLLLPSGAALSERVKWARAPIENEIVTWPVIEPQHSSSSSSRRFAINAVPCYCSAEWRWLIFVHLPEEIDVEEEVEDNNTKSRTHHLDSCRPQCISSGGSIGSDSDLSWECCTVGSWCRVGTGSSAGWIFGRNPESDKESQQLV